MWRQFRFNTYIVASLYFIDMQTIVYHAIAIHVFNV